MKSLGGDSGRAAPGLCCNRMNCWQYSPMRQLGACAGNRNSRRRRMGKKRAAKRAMPNMESHAAFGSGAELISVQPTGAVPSEFEE